MFSVPALEYWTVPSASSCCWKQAGSQIVQPCVPIIRDKKWKRRGLLPPSCCSMTQNEFVVSKQMCTPQARRKLHSKLYWAGGSLLLCMKKTQKRHFVFAGKDLYLSSNLDAVIRLSRTKLLLLNLDTPRTRQIMVSLSFVTCLEPSDFFSSLVLTEAWLSIGGSVYRCNMSNLWKQSLLSISRLCLYFFSIWNFFSML